MSSPKRLFDFIYNQQEKFPQEKCYVYKKDTYWESISTQQFLEQVNIASRALLNLGIKPNDKIAVISSNNRPEWHVLDIATLQIGAQNVPLYPTLSEKDYEYIINHSDALYCFVSDKELLKKVTAVKAKTQLKGVFTFDEINAKTNWSSFLELGKSEDNQPLVEKLKKAVKPDDLATIIYTSGTTGTPKGVMLSHRNIVENTLVSADALDLKGTHHRVVSYLPINHIFERFASYYYHLMGFEVHFAESIEKLGDNLKEIQPHFIPVVPRLIEKVFDKIVAKGNELSGIKRVLFFWALALAGKYKPYHQNSLFYNFKLKIARKLIFSKWQAALGGELHFMVSGSAPLQERLITIFTAAGIPIFEGYGMTETSPGVSINDLRNDGFKVGTVGKILKNIEVKIADDGEILVKGSNIMLGYYKNEELTHKTIIDGYLHTGDIGTLDKDGFLKITDRKKEMFKTSGGKYIAPAVLESVLKQSRFIEQAMVIGESKKMPAALIQINFNFVKEWAKRKNYNITNVATDINVISRIQKEIDNYNTNFGRWEQIKKFEITPEEWTIEDDLLTPTMKMKRKNIKKKYNYLFQKIYNS
ncbi:Long-chain-fatty-acid--CoA ligase FadD15 [Polaribacter huanghezhanensis]|uniref:AMP-dependent synthetase/ligase n=1 Tax=Polaribacter huanghezhanensis TaxID=1354726 RepID=UPI00264784C8|nr:long-chain fatty acid--CoA ligase [Polaribacter huanghezhanensis]WKD86769.1 Long-chain-fatty-acid--CoA ligase FadD15 [Polaribacter huanghezhanensis]